MFISTHNLRRIKELDLARIISSYGIQTRHSGNGSYQALCPFHNDTHPSLSITKKNNGVWLWHCFGCAAKGTVIDFIMKKEGITFKEVYRKLLEKIDGDTLEGIHHPSHPTSIIQHPTNPRELLNRAAEFYHHSFKEDRRGVAYISKRGITEPEIWTYFRIGFVNGSLRKTLPEGGPVLDTLKQLGLLNERGNEHFYNCVIFPIFDEDGNAVSFYGRKADEPRPGGTDNPEERKHLYPAGPHKGVFHSRALKTTKKIFLTEAVIDCLSLYQMGIKEAVSLYGTNGLTAEHLELFQKYMTEEIYLCLDNDAAGREAAPAIAARLAGLGIKVYQITLPEGIKDVNEYLLSGKTKEDFNQLIETATVAGGKEAVMSGGGQISKDETQITFDWRNRTYRIRGLNVSRLDQMRVTIKLSVSCGNNTNHAGGAQGADGAQGANGAYYLDTVDLCNARSRQGFASCAKKTLGLDTAIISADLNYIVGQLENEQAGMLEAGNKKQETELQMSGIEKQEATAFLRAPNLFERILEDFKACGYVGEEMNLLLGYITAVSRKLQHPLATLIVSRSASGKSTLQDAVLSFIPPEDYEKYTRLTDQALFYKDENALRHKLLAIEEEKGASGAGYSLRNLQSAHGLRIAATIKDPATGKLKTDVYKVCGPTAIMITTAFQESFDYETYNRFIILTIDETIEQTRLILERQRLNETIEGLVLKKQRARLCRLHHNAQRLLKPLEVANPYSQQLTFITSVLRARREQPKYLSIIKAVALLRQYQKEIKTADGGLTANSGLTADGGLSADGDGEQAALVGQTAPGGLTADGGFEYIEVDLKDIELANNIANEILGRSLDEMSPPARRLLVEIKHLIDKTVAAEKIPPEKCVISRRDIREYTGWSDYQIRAHIKELEELEYLVPVSGSNGKRFTYRLVWDGQGEDGSKFMLGLIDVETLRGCKTLTGCQTLTGCATLREKRRP